MDTKKCNKCELELPIDSFRSSRSNQWACKKCLAEYYREYKKKQKNGEWQRKLRSRFELDEMFTSGAMECIKCNNMLPVDEFPKDNRNTRGLSNTCKSCQANAKKKLRSRRLQRELTDSEISKHLADANSILVTCRKCQQELPRDAFHNDPASSIGRKSICKDCISSYRANRKISKPGATYDTVLSAQGAKCAICGSTDPGGRNTVKRFAVDHDHITGRVRGLLCMRCNFILGQVGDDVSIMQKAIEYLLENKESI